MSDEHIGWYTVGHGPISNGRELFGALPGALIGAYLGSKKGVLSAIVLSGVGWAIGEAVLEPTEIDDTVEIDGLWQILTDESEGTAVTDPSDVSLITKLLRLLGINA